MKRLILFMALAISTIASGQNTTASSFFGGFDFSGMASGGTSDYTGDIINFSDQTNQYFANAIAVGDILWDNLGNRWEVVVVNSSTISSADVDIRDINSVGSPPFGRGAVVRETSNAGISTPPTANSLGITDQLFARILNHNANVLDTYLGTISGGGGGGGSGAGALLDTLTQATSGFNELEPGYKDATGAFVSIKGTNNAASATWVIHDIIDANTMVLANGGAWANASAVTTTGYYFQDAESGTGYNTTPDTARLLVFALTGSSAAEVHYFPDEAIIGGATEPSDGNKGDVTVSGSGTDWQINTDAVGANELDATGVTPGAYTNPNLTITSDGRIATATNGTGGGGGGNNVYNTDSIINEVRNIQLTGPGRLDIQTQAASGVDGFGMRIYSGYSGDNATTTWLSMSTPTDSIYFFSNDGVARQIGSGFYQIWGTAGISIGLAGQPLFLNGDINNTAPVGGWLQKQVQGGGEGAWTPFGAPTTAGADGQVLKYDLATNSLVWGSDDTVGGGTVGNLSQVTTNGNTTGGNSIVGLPAPTAQDEAINLQHYQETDKRFNPYADHLDRVKFLPGGRVVLTGGFDFYRDGYRYRIIPASSPDTFTLANNQQLVLDIANYTLDGTDRTYDETDLLTTFARNDGYLILAQYAEDTANDYWDYTGLWAQNWDRFLMRNANEQLKVRYHEGRVTFNDAMNQVTINGDIEMTSRDGRAVVIRWASYPQVLDPPAGFGYTLDLTATPLSQTSQRTIYDGATAVTTNDEANNISPNYRDIWLILERCRDCTTFGAGLLFDAYATRTFSDVLRGGTDAGNNEITNAGYPTADKSLVVKSYVDSLTQLIRQEPQFLRNIHQDRVTFSESGSNGVITFSNDVEFVYPWGVVRINFSTIPQTFNLLNNQYLYLDLTTPTASGGNFVEYDETSVGTAYTSNTGNRINLAMWTEDKQAPYRWAGPLYYQSGQRVEILNASETNWTIRYKPGQAEFSEDRKRCRINGPIEFGVRNGNWIRLQFDSYPQTVDVDGGDVYVLDLTAPKDAASDFRFDIYNWSEAVDTVPEFNLANINSTTIPLLGEDELDQAEFGHGIIFDTYYDPDKIEKLQLRGDVVQNAARIISNQGNKLAHDHNIQIVMRTSDDKLYQVTSYQYNDVVETEVNNNQEVRGKLIDFYTGQTIVDTVLLAGNTTYRNITTQDERCGHPHSYQINDSIVITALNNGIGLYQTELNLNQEEWSNLDFFQCSFGAGQVDVDTAAVKTYIRSRGISSAVVNPHNKLRLRNADQIQSKTDTAWYAIIDLYEEPSANPGATSIPVLIFSGDQGLTWSARGLPYDEAQYPNGLSENALVILNDTLYSVGRGSGGYHLSKSADFGWTWTTPTLISGLGLGTSGSIHKFIHPGTLEEWAIFAYNGANVIEGHRTRMRVDRTQDFVNFESMLILDALEGAHYPAIDIHSGNVYIQYTSGIKTNTSTDVFDYDISSNSRDGIWQSKFPMRWFFNTFYK